MKKFMFFAVTAILVIAFAVFGLTPVQADGSISWGGNGSENLPCSGGAHWVLAPADGITGATLHVNGSDYTMSQSGNGSWSADSSGALEVGLSASVSFTGEGSDGNHLQLSHCVNSDPTNTPEDPTLTPTPEDPTETPQITPTPTNTPEVTPDITPTATKHHTNDPTPTPEPKVAPITGGGLPSPLFLFWQWILSLFN